MLFFHLSAPTVASIHSLEGESSSVTLRLEDLLAFTTGADQIPPLGFDGIAQVNFLHEGWQILPTACTCAPSISLPTVHETYDSFKAAMVEEIVSGFGFGLV